MELGFDCLHQKCPSAVLKDVTLIVKMFGSGRQVEGQKGQRKVRQVKGRNARKSLLIVVPGSELQVLLSFLCLFVYILTSVFCPNEAASSYFFIFFCKTPLDFCRARSTSSAI